ncbi:hypothetical protein KAI87_14545, partial [Myxococcota bacterium]|nr:hypothetical protein [Myxococcota bacterium]
MFYKSTVTDLFFGTLFLGLLLSLSACNDDTLGVAAAPDLCIDVECPAQNEGFCDGDTVVKVAGEGECLAHNGLCDYSLVETQVDCAADAMVCLGVECVDLCADVLCPGLAPYCRDNTQISYAEAGICDWRTGDCEYSSEIDGTNCEETEEICHNGACLDLCDSVECPQPDAECLTTDSLVEYSDVGVCDWNNGFCSYEAVQTVTHCNASEQVCENGACVDLCADVVCAKPGAYCLDDGTETVVSYIDEGYCLWENARCDYS